MQGFRCITFGRYASIYAGCNSPFLDLASMALNAVPFPTRSSRSLHASPVRMPEPVIMDGAASSP